MATDQTIIGNDGRKTNGNEQIIDRPDRSVSNGSTPTLGNDGNIGSGTGSGNTDSGSTHRKRRNKVETSEATIEVQAPEVKNAPSKRIRAKRKDIPTQPLVNGTESAQALMQMVEVFAVAKFGMIAMFTPTERTFIETSLARIIEKYGNLADRYSALVDPLMVLIGSVLYIRRLSVLAQPPAPVVASDQSVQTEPVSDVGHQATLDELLVSMGREPIR